MPIEVGTRMHSGEEINGSTATQPLRVVAPLTGAIVTNAFDERTLYVTPAATIAALTLRLPPAGNSGAVFVVSFSQIVTTLTVQDSAAVAVETTAGAIGRELQYRYTGAAWVRWA